MPRKKNPATERLTHSQRNQIQAKANGYAYQRKYDAKMIKRITIPLNREYDADVIELWERLENKRQWFINKAREDIEKGL